MKYNPDPNESVTGVVVNYCTPNETHKAVTSLKKCYPHMKIIIVDGSPNMTPGYFMCAHLANEMHKNIHIPVGRNIGHGPGLVKGIAVVQTPLALIFDSDIIVNDKPLERMIELMNEREEVYGCGQVITTNTGGVNAASGIKYLHPHFALLDRKKYYEFRPFANHGAPMIAAMNDVHRTGKDLIIDFPVKQYVFHTEKVTRRLKPKEFNSRNWDKKVH